MKVCILSDDGALIWWRATEPAAGFTSDGYLRDGTQQKIIAALVEALAEARSQLGGFSLQIIDAVTDVGTAPANVDRHVPIAIVWDRDTSR